MSSGPGACSALVPCFLCPGHSEACVPPPSQTHTTHTHTLTASSDGGDRLEKALKEAREQLKAAAAALPAPTEPEPAVGPPSPSFSSALLCSPLLSSPPSPLPCHCSFHLTPPPPLPLPDEHA